LQRRFTPTHARIELHALTFAPAPRVLREREPRTSRKTCFGTMRRSGSRARSAREKKCVEHAKIVWQCVARSLCSARESHRLSRDFFPEPRA